MHSSHMGRAAARFLGATYMLALCAAAWTESDVPRLEVSTDFTACFAKATATDALAVSASLSERVGGVSLPGVFLHPKDASDAVLGYSDIEVPQCAEGESVFLLFRIGMRDGIPWEDESRRPNGVRFMISVDGGQVFAEDRQGPGWSARAVDLGAWAGRVVTIEFRTNAIDGDTSHDWAVFGEPVLARLVGGGDPSSLPKERAGVAIAELTCTEPADVRLSVGSVVEDYSLEPGNHLVAVHFASADGLVLDVTKGVADLVSVRAALHAPKLEFGKPELSSPLVTLNRPFRVIQKVKNVGLGTYPGGDALTMVPADDASRDALGGFAGEELPLGPLGPGEETNLIWSDIITVVTPGDLAVRTTQVLPFHAFKSEPQTPAGRSGGKLVDTPSRGDIRGIVGNAWCRLCFVVDDSNSAYAIAETWNGAAWQRVASLFPLARVAIRREDGTREDLTLEVRNVHHAEPTWLVVYCVAKTSAGVECPVLITYSPDPDSPRILMDFELLAPGEADLVVFQGPTVLAGDRSFGVAKDFALFPGLEYLEGDEESSSTRDLAPPLNDRRVPACYKIATPLMAVQAQDALISLLWDEKQQWTPGERHPAARFVAPGPDSGSGHIHMSLSAPNVGDYVTENEFEASHPYPVKTGQRLGLKAWLVLDHKSRYPEDDLAHGPHKGGLVLKAMQHWFDVYGLPAPSSPPRDWEQEKQLCRSAYLRTVWNSEPPGWSHCAGWPSGAFVGHSVPLLLDIREGVAPNLRKNIEERVGLVIDRAISERGRGSLWSSDGCHIMMGELPFYRGYLADSMKGFKQAAIARLAGRENGLWVWRPAEAKHATLGTPGDHTLGQAAYPSMVALRAARLTGDPDLASQALDAMRQMERYEVPRGAQMWECPLYQPDILAAANAVRAYCEAYRLTGDAEYLKHARYWAWTGLPFIYMWELDGYPTMRYNVIAVIGSTFHTHSWIGLPVVWCGLVYGYALLDLAEFDDSFPWKTVAEGMLNSAMWQQYSQGSSKGCYPDSWNMVINKPNPADINPENILVNGFRLRGLSPEIRHARFENESGSPVMLNSAADIVATAGSLAEGEIRFTLESTPGFDVYSLLARVPEPTEVAGAGEKVDSSDDLNTCATGWMYDPDLHAIILKHTMAESPAACQVRW